MKIRQHFTDHIISIFNHFYNHPVPAKRYLFRWLDVLQYQSLTAMAVQGSKASCNISYAGRIKYKHDSECATITNAEETFIARLLCNAEERTRVHKSATFDTCGIGSLYAKHPKIKQNAISCTSIVEISQMVSCDHWQYHLQAELKEPCS